MKLRDKVEECLAEYGWQHCQDRDCPSLANDYCDLTECTSAVRAVRNYRRRMAWRRRLAHLRSGSHP